MRCKKIFPLLILLMSLFSTLKSQTVDEVITNYIKFTGGVHNWKAIRSMVTTGMYDYGGIEFPFKTYAKRPDLYKVLVSSKGKYFAQAYDGKEGWKIDAFKNETEKTILTGKAATTLTNEADVELENPFINYQQKGHHAELQGRDTVKGQYCYKVVFTRNNGAVETYFFTTDHFKLIKKIADAKNAELENAVLDTWYSDYRTVGGIKLPFKTVYQAGEQMILTVTVKKVSMNVSIPDSEFKR